MRDCNRGSGGCLVEQESICSLGHGYYCCEHYRDNFFALYPRAKKGDILEYEGNPSNLFTKGKRDAIQWDDSMTPIATSCLEKKKWRIIKKPELKVIKAKKVLINISAGNLVRMVGEDSVLENVEITILEK